MRFRIALIGLLLLGAAIQPARAEKWLCHPTSRAVCSDGECTRPALASLYFVIEEGIAYNRCDRNGCGRHSIRQSVSGNFVTYEIPGSAAFLRREIGNNSFIEVASLGLTVYTYFGRCRAG